MPFQFQWLCELLDDLHNNLYRRTLSIVRVQNYEHQLIYNWYQRYSHRIERTGPSAIAFLSCLLPERRPDRVYNLKAKRLSQVFGRALCLGTSRATELNGWQNQDGADFATCVERILKQCENDQPAPGKEVTLEEINEALDLVAAHALSSSPVIRAKLTNATPTELLGPILRRLQSNEAKWFIRMLLKSYAPVQIPEYQALHGFHFMLPNLLTIQNSFDAAVTVLGQKAICQLPARPEKNYEIALHPLVAEHVKPRLGVMIKRQPYHKARSIKNCCSLAKGRQMSIERKYDGEYCQIHVDLSKGHDCIQIFSKSGRDSTSDRIRLCGAIQDALRIDRNGCRIRERCVIEGELLVWNVSTRQIQPFHKIRKYVKHGGREIGTAQDSPSRPEEHLMIAFYDLLILDHRMLLNEPHKVRRQHLKAVLQTMEGRAILCEREIIDFRAKGASSRLRQMFANAITQRWEGLVLKGLQEPYFAWNGQKHGIKLKKDYIAGLGDSADLCILGGRRDPQIELEIGLGQLAWTTFYVGAVSNMDEVRRFDAKPRIMIIDVLTHHSMPDSELLDLNRLGNFLQVEFAPETDYFVVEMDRLDLLKPTALFKQPFVVEIMGAGFEKMSNSSLFTLRFPRKIDGKVKLHTDRTLLDTVSLSELQSMAEQSLEVPVDQDSQEDARWIEQLIKADGRKRCTESVSQGSTCVRTVASASAASLSPIALGVRASSRIYVRPDTEEPETQSPQSTNTSIDKVGTPMGLLSSSVNPAKAQCPQHNPRKRSLEALAVLHRDGLTEKKQRLGNRTSNGEMATSILSISKTNLSIPRADQRTPALHRYTGHQDSPLVEQACVDTSEAPANFTSQKSITDMAEVVEEPLSESLVTPDSTLLMRQILLTSHSHGDGLTAYSPTNILSDKNSFRHTPANTQTSDQFHSTNVSFIPTPPTSSPAAIKVVESQLASQPAIASAGFEVTKIILQTTMTDDTGPTTTHNQIETGTTLPHSALSNNNTQQSPIALRQQSVQVPSAELPPILILMPKSTPSTILTKIDADFNFSITRFLTQLDTHADHDSPPPQTYHIIIIDSLVPDLAADAFEALAHATQSHLTNRHRNFTSTLARHNTSGNILVFDRRVLEHASVADNGGRVDIDVLRRLDFNRGHGTDAELFCGVLVFFEVENEADVVVETGSRAGGGGLKVGIDLDYRFDWLAPS